MHMVTSVYIHRHSATQVQAWQQLWMEGERNKYGMNEMKNEIQKEEQEEIWGDFGSSCWQSPVLSQELNHPCIHPPRLGGFIQKVFISYLFFLLSPLLCYRSAAVFVSHFLSACCLSFLNTHTSSSLLSSISMDPCHYLHQQSWTEVILFCDTIIAECNQMRWSTWHWCSLALHKSGSKENKGRKSAVSDLCYMQTSMHQITSRQQKWFIHGHHFLVLSIKGILNLPSVSPFFSLEFYSFWIETFTFFNHCTILFFVVTTWTTFSS